MPPKWKPPMPTVAIPWSEVSKINLEDYESGRMPMDDLEGWIDTASQFRVDSSDEHLQDVSHTAQTIRLMRLLLARVDFDANKAYTEKEAALQKLTVNKEKIAILEEQVRRAGEEREDAHKNFVDMESVADGFKKDKERLQKELRLAQRDIKRGEEDLAAAQKETDIARKESRRLQRELDDLKRVSTANQQDFSKTEQSNSQLLAEHQHLLTKYRSATDDLKTSQQALADLQASSKAIHSSLEEEIRQHRSHILSLQQDSVELTQSRDKAEAQLEKRELEALQDLQEMQELQQAQVEEERSRYFTLRDQYVQLKTDYDILRLQDEVTVSPQEIRAKDDQINRLTKELNEIKENGYSPAGDQAGGRPASVAATDAMVNRLLQQKTKLESENDQLQNEVRGLELRLDAQDAENLRLAKEIKEYEMGDEGLRRLRNDLQDQRRMNATLSDECSQLRERLGHMEDNVSLCAALKELCLRMGVTQDEIDRLHSNGFANHNELETLRQEVRALKEEVEWVEKERKHWMRKVRLQPLLDTKLRFELGLTADQLKQLDGIVDQMKSGGVVVDEGDYRDKYYEEVRLRQREVKAFNEEIRNRIEGILGSFVATGGRGGDSNLASELRRLHEQASGAAQSAQHNLSLSEEARGAAAQASALERKVYQHELSDQDHVTVLARLNDHIARLEAEQEVLRRERDTYRTAVLELARAGVEGGQPLNVDAFGQSAPPSVVIDGQSVASSVHADTSLEGAESHLENDDAEGLAAVTALMGRRRAQVRSGMVSAQEGGRLVELLKNQLQSKDELIRQIERQLLHAREEIAEHVESATEVRRQLDSERQRGVMLLGQAEAASKAADEAECRVEHLERLKADLEALCNRQLPPQAGELLQKIVALRQREARMAERLRAFMRKEDALQQQCDEQQARIDELLLPIKEFLSGTAVQEAAPSKALHTVLPTTQGVTAMERQVLTEMQDALARLGRGEVLEEDMAFIKEAQRLYAGLHSSGTAQNTQRALLAARREVANLKHLINEERILRRHVEAQLAGASSVKPAESEETPAAMGRDAKVALLESKLDARAEEIGLLEAALREAEERYTDKVAAMEKAQREAASYPSDPQHPTNTSAAVMGNGKAAALVHRLEGELAKYKSMNLGLVIGAIDDSRSRAALQILVRAKEKEVVLLKESGMSHRLSEFVTAALTDNTNLQQQLSMSEHVVKRMRLQMVTSEANFRVASSEAASYKVSAYRLYRSYVEHVRQIISTVRRVQRQCEGAMTPREVVILQKRLSDLEERGAEAEHHVSQLSGEGAVKDEIIRMLNAESAALKSGKGAEAGARINADNVAQLRQLKRAVGELKSDLQHEQGKLQAAHAYEADMAAELSRLEIGTGFLSLDDDFANKMEQLYETVFNRVSEPSQLPNPHTGSVLPGVSGVNLSTGAMGDEAMLRTYRDALHQQSSLSKQVTTLQRELGDIKKQLSAVTDKEAMLRDELSRAEARAHEANSALEQERLQAKSREDRLAAAHMSQRDLLENAMNHNIRCLKDIISNKEKALERATEQLSTERQRYLEHQLLDTSRIERLHDQLFRENSAMVEKFKASLNDNGPPLENVGVPHPQSTQGGFAEQTAHVQQLTSEVLTLRGEIRELRQRNITLESAHGDLIVTHQRQLRELALEGQAQRHHASLAHPYPAPSHNTGVPPIESTLYNLTHEQSIALDGMRRREAELLADLGRAQEEAVRLRALLDEHERQARPPAPLHSRLSPALVNDIAASFGGESVADLRVYISSLEGQLREAQNMVAESRQREAESIASFRKQLADSKANVEAQAVQVDRTAGLTRGNEELRRALRDIRGQHDKMVSAVALLKQELIRQQTSSGEAEAGRKQDMAIAQRMGALQVESAQSIEQMQQRLEAVQKEVNARVDKEEELLAKAKKAQATALSQLQELEAKDATIRALRAEIDRIKLRYRDTRSAGVAPAAVTSTKTKVQLAATPQTANEKTTGPVDEPLSVEPTPSIVLPPGFTPATGFVGAEKTTQTVELRTVSNDGEGPTAPPVTATPTTFHIGVNSVPPTAEAAVQVDMKRREDAQPQNASQTLTSSVRKPSLARKSSPPQPAPKLGVPNDLVVRLRKEHEAELTKFNYTIHRLENQLRESEDHLKRERLAWEVKRDRYEARASADKAKLQPQEGAVGRTTSPMPITVPPTPQPLPTTEGVLPDDLKTAIILVSASTQTPTVTVVPVSPNTSLYASAPTTRPSQRSHVDVSGGAHEREVVAASSDLRLHTVIRRQRAEIEGLTSRLRDADTLTATLQHKLEAAPATSPRAPLRVRLSSHPKAETPSNFKENLDKLPSDEVVTIDLAYLPAAFDVRRFKGELVRMESRIDDLNRVIGVVKEAEIRRLESEKAALDGRVRELEAALAARGGCGCNCEHDLREKAKALSALETRLLTQEGALLDHRFERELYNIKSDRLNAHVREVLEVDRIHEFAGSIGSNHPVHVGRSPPPSGRSSTPLQQASVLRSKQREVANLEAVVSGLRGVLERVQHENAQLKANAVPVSQYNACQRELTALRTRERDLVAYIQEMGMKQRLSTEPTTSQTPTPDTNEESLNTRRLRTAQAIALGYQAELADLRSKVALPLSPPPREASRPPPSSSASPPAVASALQVAPNPQRVLNLSPYAPEHHAADRHHHWAQ